MRRALALLTAAVLAGSCTPSSSTAGLVVADASPSERTDAIDVPVLPAATPTPSPSPSPTPTPSPVPTPTPPPAFALEPVDTLLPEVVLTAPDGGPLDSDVVAAALGAPGVSFATVVALGSVPMTLPDGRSGELRIAGVDPAGFRVLVPQITADEPAVWERLAEGHLALTHELSGELGLALDDELTAPGGPLRLAVIAALGQPPIAAGVVDLIAGQRLGLGPPTTLLVAIEGDAWPDEVAATLERALGLEATLVYGKPQRRIAGLPDGTVWDRLAMCEASGNWRADTGNGYYGGLQFLPSSWHLVGGVGLPHEASRDEQIYRAELLLARQGWRAWPVCSVRLGLREPEPDEHPDGRPKRPPASPAGPSDDATG